MSTPESMGERELLVAILHEVRALARKVAASGVASGEVKPADDRELDSDKGNPTIRKDPPRWGGEPMVGRRYSDTSPEYLDSLASFLGWKLGRGGYKEAKFEDYDRRDLARALGWAARMRANPGMVAPAAKRPAAPAEWSGEGADWGAPGGDSDIPF